MESFSVYLRDLDLHPCGVHHASRNRSLFGKTQARVLLVLDWASREQVMAAQTQLSDSVLIKLRGINANCFFNLFSFILSLSNGVKHHCTPWSREPSVKGLGL